MSLNFNGGAKVYDGEVYIADVAFSVKGDRGEVLSFKKEESPILHKKLIDERKSLTLRGKDGEFSIKWSGKFSFTNYWICTVFVKNVG